MSNLHQIHSYFCYIIRNQLRRRDLLVVTVSVRLKSGSRQRLEDFVILTTPEVKFRVSNHGLEIFPVETETVLIEDEIGVPVCKVTWWRKGGRSREFSDEVGGESRVQEHKKRREKSKQPTRPLTPLNPPMSLLTVSGSSDRGLISLFSIHTSETLESSVHTVHWVSLYGGPETRVSGVPSPTRRTG